MAGEIPEVYMLKTCQYLRGFTLLVVAAFSGAVSHGWGAGGGVDEGMDPPLFVLYCFLFFEGGDGMVEVVVVMVVVVMFVVLMLVLVLLVLLVLFVLVVVVSMLLVLVVVLF